MSFKERSLYNKKIETEIEQNKISLESILSEPNLSIMMNQKLPKLTSFLILHVRDIIEYSFIKKTDDDMIQANSYSILSDFQPVRSIISKDPNLINMIIQYFLDGTGNTILLINLLRHIIESSNALALHQIDQSNAFFKNLLDNMNKIYIREFLIFLFSHPNLAPFRKWFYDIKADEVLYQKINKEESEFVQEKILFLLSKYILMVDKGSVVLQRLASHEKISYILNLGLNSTKISLSGEAFKYIFTLCQSISDSERLRTNMSEIRSLLSKNCEKLCNYVQLDHTFYYNKQYSIELIIIVISFKTEVEKFVFNFAHFLLDLFKELKTNSFLHKSFLKLFRVLTAFKEDFTNFANSTKLLDLIVSLVDQKATLLSSYWGHIYKMSGILNKMQEDDQYELTFDEKWQTYINKVYKIQHKIIKANYGGRLPKNNFSDDSDDSTSGSIFYHTHFVDSCDLIARAYKKQINSSDSDSSDEYEEDTSSQSSSDSNAEEED